MHLVEWTGCCEPPKAAVEACAAIKDRHHLRALAHCYEAEGGYDSRFAWWIYHHLRVNDDGFDVGPWALDDKGRWVRHFLGLEGSPPAVKLVQARNGKDWFQYVRPGLFAQWACSGGPRVAWSRDVEKTKDSADASLMHHGLRLQDSRVKPWTDRFPDGLCLKCHRAEVEKKAIEAYRAAGGRELLHGRRTS